MVELSAVGGSQPIQRAALQAPPSSRPVNGTNNVPEQQQQPQRVEQSAPAQSTLRAAETGKGNVIDVIG